MMDEKRKNWLEKYKVGVGDVTFKGKPLGFSENGFVANYCLPKHVKYVLPSTINNSGAKPYFIGFDGRKKSYEELTEEEKQDYNNQLKDLKELDI